MYIRRFLKIFKPNLKIISKQNVVKKMKGYVAIQLPLKMQNIYSLNRNRGEFKKSGSVIFEDIEQNESAN